MNHAWAGCGIETEPVHSRREDRTDAHPTSPSSRPRSLLQEKWSSSLPVDYLLDRISHRSHATPCHDMLVSGEVPNTAHHINGVY